MENIIISVAKDFNAPRYVNGGHWPTEESIVEYVITRLTADQMESVRQHAANGFQLLTLFQQGGWRVPGWKRVEGDILFEEWRTYRQTDHHFMAILARPTGERRDLATKDGGGYIFRRAEAPIYETPSGVRFGMVKIPGDAGHYSQTVIVVAD